MKYNNSDIEYLKKYVKEHNLENSFYQKCLKELEKGKPIQYIIGNVNFYGYDIKVDKNVLIPRYETELLCEKAINKIKSKYHHKIDILDLGTGSGCIAITLKKELNCNVDALDISKKALKIAKNNAKINKVLINYINGDMTSYKEKKYDVIISNPPYIRYDEEIMDIVKDYEPHIALYAKDNGLYYYKKIIDNIPFITKNQFFVALEIGAEEAEDIIKYAKEKLKDVIITKEKDYSDKDRYIFIEKKDTLY